MSQHLIEQPYLLKDKQVEKLCTEKRSFLSPSPSDHEDQSRTVKQPEQQC